MGYEPGDDMQYELTELQTGMPAMLAMRPDTPRMALAIAVKGGLLHETVPGTAKLASRLLLKGTASRSAEALARELDERAIDLREIVLTDSNILLAVFLNREFDAVLELVADVLLHSTFDDFEKERDKLQGEIQSSLDLPAEQAHDLLIRSLFPGHPYGDTGVRVLESLPALSEAAVRLWFLSRLHPLAMAVSLVGDFIPENVLPRLAETFAALPGSVLAPPLPAFAPLAEDRIVTETRPDANQAQIYQGWYAPRLGAPEQAATTVMNTVLGAAGLSSRLFTELRDKQGLAYSVRSQYQPMGQTGEFLISIGTSPENVTRARVGFTEQLARIQQEPITLEELQNTKGRMRGSYVLSHETTRQQCLDLVIGQINGLGPDYSEKLLQQIEQVTIADVQAAAQAITPPSVTAIVAREDALPAG